jgi:PAS domain S-box-containing protein
MAKHSTNQLGNQKINKSAGEDQTRSLTPLSTGVNRLMEHIQDGYFEIDAQGRLETANAAFCTAFNIQKDTLQSFRFENFLSSDPLEGRQLFESLVRRASADTPTIVKLFDMQGRTRKMALFLVEIPDTVSGITRGYQGVVYDSVSKQKMAAGLARTKKFLQSIIHSTIEGFATTDLHNTLVYVSPRILEMTGYSKEKLLGNHLAGLFRAGEYDVRLIDRALREEGVLRDHETQLNTYKRDQLDVSLSVSILRDDAGVNQGNLIICRDITESKRLEAQVRFSQRMEAIGTLAGGIAHNFNNLLMGIQGNTTLLMLDTDPDHPNFKRILNIEKHIQSGSRLTRQLIAYAREGKYQVQAINLNHIIRETTEAFEATKQGIDFVYHLDPELPGVMADRGQLEQVLLNLLVNGVDAMPDGGRMTIETRTVSYLELEDKPYQPAPGQYLAMAVSDTGQGMDESTRKRVFEPFFTTKGLDRGNGLGLASCYGVIKAHGGYIDVESKPGKGSRFTIYLPASNQPVSTEYDDCDQCFLGSETILVVDDEPMVLEVTREILELLGYRVLTADSGGEAIRIYREEGDSIDLIILDMIMPEMGGDKTFEALHRLDPHIKVLLASGYSMEGKAAIMLEQGCAGFIQKPFDLPSISLKLREILETASP